MKRKRFTLLRTALTLSTAFLVATGSNANPIDITFSARGEASNVESVTITNLTHTDIKAVTLNGTAVLQLIDPDELIVGDVNADNKVDVADIASVLSIMAGNKPSSARFVLGKPAAGANVVKMDFHPGDILRFEGKSGEMRTIVVNVPKISHEVPFSFYPCKDLEGNTYTIIEAGGLLWMAEDLKCKVGIAPYFQNQSARWADAAQHGYIKYVQP